MASSTRPSTSQNPKVEKEDDHEAFDLLKLSKVEEESKIDLEEMHSAGIRFIPKDDDLLVYYLFNKILDRLLPITGIIKEIDDLYNYDPNQLPIDDFKDGKKGNEAFYFTYIQQINSSKGKVTKRTTNCGYWKATGEEEEITYGHGDVKIGFKNYMAFYQGHEPNGSKTPFAMHEYRLNPSVVPLHLLNDAVRTKIVRYVVWRIINKAKLPGSMEMVNEIDMEEIA